MVQKKTTDELIRERPALEELQRLPRTPITVIADNIRSLDNVGLLFRLCELARVDKLHLTGYTGYPYREGDSRPQRIRERHNHRITKTAVYAVPYQPWEYTQNPLPLVQELKEKGNTVIAIEQTTQSVPYHKALVETYQLPLTLILGHEREGIRHELLELADTIVDIPILGLGNSHNVAVSCAIVLYHILAKTKQI